MSAGPKLRNDLLDITHQVGHVQPIRREIAETAAIVATPCSDQTSRGQKAASRQKIAARRRVVTIGPTIATVIDGLQYAGFHVAENLRPQMDSLPYRQSVGVWSSLVGTRQHMQSAEDDLGAALDDTNWQARMRGGRKLDAR